MDWTTISSSVVAAGAVLAGGWIAARQQLKTSKLQFDQARTTEADKTIREAVEGRKATYHAFLNAERGLRRMVAAEPEVSVDELRDWAESFTDLYNLVVLTAIAPVGRLATELAGVFQDLNRDAQSVEEPARFSEALRLVYGRHQRRVDELRGQLLAAMRADVGPAPGHETATLWSATPKQPRFVRLAVVPETKSLAVEELERVVDALRVQIERDFADQWDVTAQIDVFDDRRKVPADHWPILIRKAKQVVERAGRSSFHSVQEDGRPYAVIGYEDGWSLRLSHECLDMLANPFGWGIVRGPSPKPRQGTVRFHVQVCDPCRADESAYYIDAVLVSDFCYPTYYEATAPAGVPHSFNRSVRQPLSVAPGGDLTWFDDSSKKAWLLNYWSEKPEIEAIGSYPSFEDFRAAALPRVPIDLGL
jgi:hypothetical protein